MKQQIPLQIAVEDDLSERVVRKILFHSGRPYLLGTPYIGRGFGYLRKTIRGFNNAAKGIPFLVLTDLDQASCPPALIESWLNIPQHPNLIFRVAVREVESWLLADHRGLCSFLGIRGKSDAPINADSIQDPKSRLIDLATRSPRRDLRSDIVPPVGSTRKVGPNYNGRLMLFVEKGWSINSAKQASPSLARTVEAVSRFIPTWRSQSA